MPKLLAAERKLVIFSHLQNQRTMALFERFEFLFYSRMAAREQDESQTDDSQLQNAGVRVSESRDEDLGACILRSSAIAPALGINTNVNESKQSKTSCGR